MKSYSLPTLINRRIGKAFHDYSMLEDGDKVVLAVSGGVDSLVLSWLLFNWRKKAPIQYSLYPIYIDSSFADTDSETKNQVADIRYQLDKIGLALHVEQHEGKDNDKRTCFSCAKQRRKQLFEYAKRTGCNKLALGHHKDDLVETFLLNVFFSGNISTMTPKQELFNGNLYIIRPMAYLEKNEVLKIAGAIKLEAIENLCPLADHTKREYVRELLDGMYSKDNKIKNSIFAALGNVRDGYML